MITSVTNVKVKYVRRLQSDKRFRQREGAFVVEGTRWLQDVVASAKVKPQMLFFTAAWRSTADNNHILQQLSGEQQLVNEVVMTAMSDTETPQGVLAVLPQQPLPLPPAPSLLLILDGVSTPGNLGTILRTAAAAGADGVILAPGSVDVYNPKTVRGSMGAHLRLPIHSLDWAEITRVVSGTAVWAAVVNEGVDYTAVSWPAPSTLIIGSEAWGISKNSLQLATGRLTIPMAAQTESLNAAMAAGVILFEAARQRRASGQGSVVSNQ